jgi:outer membrane lipoprotein SlyB
MTHIADRKLSNRNGILYPMLVIAAIAVIAFSALGVAVMSGLLPRAESMMDPQYGASTANLQTQAAQPSAQPAPKPAISSGRTSIGAGACNDCGVVEAINAVDVKGQGSGLGVVAGGITGALLGNQIGRGSGRTVATIAGAAGGAYAGNEIEKNMYKAVRYQVRVRMNDGTFRTTYQPHAPAFGVGERVRVINGQVVAAG